MPDLRGALATDKRRTVERLLADHHERGFEQPHDELLEVAEDEAVNVGA